MSNPLNQAEQDRSVGLVRLNWDSEHFGWPVGLVRSGTLTDVELRSVLDQARAADFRLVYWMADSQLTSTSNKNLAEFHGRLVDRKVTFTRTFGTTNDECNNDSIATEPICVREHPPGHPNRELINLAIGAGELSRFRNDQAIPTKKFQELYETWICNSTLRKNAKTVFVATAAGGETVGLVTIAFRKNTEASIGLISVDRRYRGHGIGSMLMRSAHNYMQASGIQKASVVTQLNNESACRLYQRFGYHVQQIQYVYHFWL